MKFTTLFTTLFRDHTDLLGSYNYAKLTLGGDIPEEKKPVPIPFIKTEEQSTFWEIERFFSYFEKTNLKGLLLIINNLNIGFSRANALRNSLLRVGDAGKKIYIHLENPGNLEYFIASCADHLSISPMSTLNFTGLYNESFYLKGLLTKLDIEPEIQGVGEYKSAAETFTRTGMSESAREMLNSIIDEQFNTIVGNISESRGISFNKLYKYLDDSPFTPEKAKQYGLIDSIGYEEDLVGIVEEHNNLNLKIIEQKAVDRIIRYSSKISNIISRIKQDTGQIALVTVNGIISQGKSQTGSGRFKTAGSDTIINTLKKIENDGSIRAVVVRILSPGGSAVASDLIRNKVEHLSKKKPVYISMSDVAASGGYMASLSAVSIFADPFTITGSIGVVAGKLNFKKLLDRMGVGTEMVTRGRMSSIYSVTKGFTEDEEKKFTEIITSMYEDFVNIVSRTRNIDRKKTEQASKGRVWTGNQAKQLKLVDKLGGLRETLQLAYDDCGIKGDIFSRVKVFSHETRFSIESMGKFFGYSWLGSTLNVFEKERLYALMPFWIKIR